MIQALAASFEPDAYRSYLDFNRCFLLITPPKYVNETWSRSAT